MSAETRTSFFIRQIQSQIRRKRRKKHCLEEVGNFPRDEQGQAMTEFTIILPVLLFLVFGILQLMLISNASYMLNLANYYALRTGVVHYELYQYDFESSPSDLEAKMKEAAVKELLPIMPRLLRDPVKYFMTAVPVVLNTRPDVGQNIAESDRTNWLACQTEMPFHLYVPFAGAIIASIFHWSEWGINPSNRLLEEGILIREHPLSLGHPLWPYIWMKSRNYDFQNTRAPSNSTNLKDMHQMAIARRIYRSNNGPQTNLDE